MDENEKKVDMSGLRNSSKKNEGTEKIYFNLMGTLNGGCRIS